jgi:RNA polymerase primary sigma factor
MASEIKASSQADDESASGKDAPETALDTPLLDLSDAAVKKMIKAAKKRGTSPTSR